MPVPQTCLPYLPTMHALSHSSWSFAAAGASGIPPQSGDALRFHRSPKGKKPVVSPAPPCPPLRLHPPPNRLSSDDMSLENRLHLQCEDPDLLIEFDLPPGTHATLGASPQSEITLPLTGIPPFICILGRFQDGRVFLAELDGSVARSVDLPDYPLLPSLSIQSSFTRPRLSPRPSPSPPRKASRPAASPATRSPPASAHSSAGTPRQPRPRKHQHPTKPRPPSLRLKGWLFVIDRASSANRYD